MLHDTAYNRQFSFIIYLLKHVFSPSLLEQPRKSVI